MNTRFATSPDSTRIAFDVSGAGTPLLLLHGGGGSRADWHENGYVARLRNEFTFIAVEGSFLFLQARPSGMKIHTLGLL